MNIFRSCAARTPSASSASSTSADEGGSLFGAGPDGTFLDVEFDDIFGGVRS